MLANYDQLHLLLLPADSFTTALPVINLLLYYVSFISYISQAKYTSLENANS